jgi:hypothetical protein
MMKHMSDFERKLSAELLDHRKRLEEEHLERVGRINAALRELNIPEGRIQKRPRMEMRVSVGNRVIEERLAA